LSTANKNHTQTPCAVVAIVCSKRSYLIASVFLFFSLLIVALPFAPDRIMQQQKQQQQRDTTHTIDDEQ
jgi:hypothetical protein